AVAVATFPLASLEVIEQLTDHHGWHGYSSNLASCTNGVNHGPSLRLPSPIPPLPRRLLGDALWRQRGRLVGHLHAAPLHHDFVRGGGVLQQVALVLALGPGRVGVDPYRHRRHRRGGVGEHDDESPGHRSLLTLARNCSRSRPTAPSSAL